MSDEVEDLLREVRQSRGEPEPPPPGPDPAAPLAPGPAPAAPAPPTPGSGPAAQAAPPAVATPAAEGASEGLLSRLLAWRAGSILAHRELDLKLGDPGGTLLLLGQAPLIALLVGLAFKGKTEDKTLDFVLSMVATWFGCFNASRELVKERAIFLRERRTGLPVRGYLLAKLAVLLLLAAIQCLVLVGLVSFQVTWKGDTPLIFLGLFLTAAAASALGLFISAASPSQTVAMAVVPIVLIPQLVFSEFVLKSGSDLAERIQRVMLSTWGYELLDELRQRSTEWGVVLGHGGVLLLATVGLLLCAALFLRLQEEG